MSFIISTSVKKAVRYNINIGIFFYENEAKFLMKPTPDGAPGVQMTDLWFLDMKTHEIYIGLCLGRLLVAGSFS